jgi:hypothetical protein
VFPLIGLANLAETLGHRPAPNVPDADDLLAGGGFLAPAGADKGEHEGQGDDWRTSQSHGRQVRQPRGGSCLERARIAPGCDVLASPHCQEQQDEDAAEAEPSYKRENYADYPQSIGPPAYGPNT